MCLHCANRVVCTCVVGFVMCGMNMCLRVVFMGMCSVFNACDVLWELGYKCDGGDGCVCVCV